MRIWAVQIFGFEAGAAWTPDPTKHCRPSTLPKLLNPECSNPKALGPWKPNAKIGENPFRALLKNASPSQTP